jgi:hypothetical protein
MQLKYWTLFAAISFTPYAISGAHPELESGIIKAMQCHAQKNNLPNLDFSVENIEVTDGKLIAQLAQTDKISQKKEYFILEGTVQAQKLASLKITDEVEGSKSVSAACIP